MEDPKKTPMKAAGAEETRDEDYSKEETSSEKKYEEKDSAGEHEEKAE